MRKGDKISLVVAGLLAVGVLWVVWPVFGCLWAIYQHSKITIGMSVADVFNAVDHWDYCGGWYLDENTKEYKGFSVVKAPGGHTYRLPKDKKTIGSKSEFLQFVEKQMSNGQAWASGFTYLSGPIRCGFRVDFDRNGKVSNVTGMGTGP